VVAEKMLNPKSSSTKEAHSLLSCHRLPARLNTTETAVLLGFHEHDIPVLTAVGLLAPLGKPAPNAPKYFASVQISALGENAERLNSVG